MRIHFSPFRNEPPTPALHVDGDTLTIGGEAFDFSALGEGDRLPEDRVASPWVTGFAERINGEVHVTVFLHHGPDASAAARAWPSVTVTSGPVALPAFNGEDVQ